MKKKKTKIEFKKKWATLFTKREIWFEFIPI